MNVYPTPVANFDFTQTYIEGIPNGTISYLNQSLGANTFLWNFGDGFESTELDPVHQFYSVGSYTTVLMVSNTYNCHDTIEKSIIPDYFSGLFVPNALMPINGNGDARLFLPKGKSLREYHLEIFNSWGASLFESTALDASGSPSEGWDGTFKGELCAQDVYVWKIEAIFANGVIWQGKIYPDGKIKQTGSVTLIK